MKPFILLSLSCLLLTSCVVPSSFFENKNVTTSGVKNVNNSEWWMSFQDPLMSQFVTILEAQNLDIKIAQTRLREARALRQVAVSQFFPDISAGGNISRGELNAPKVQTLGQAGFDAAWELDIFGATRANVQATTARIQAAKANKDDVQQIVIADVARAVIEWRQAQHTITTTQSLIESQNETVEILQARAQAGLIDASLFERAKAQRDQTATNLPIAKAAANAARFQIERLLNVRDDQVAQILNAAPTQQTLIPEVKNLDAINVEIIRNRPDIRAARANLMAARADLARAEADLWPRISLSSFFGVQDGSDGARLASNPVWSLASNLTAPVLNFGRLRGSVRAADARSDQALFTYENTINFALQETRTALSDYLNGVNAVAAQNKALEGRQQTVTLARERFTRGLTDMTDLTTAQSELDTATLALIAQKTTTQIAYIRLQKALGL